MPITVRYMAHLKQAAGVPSEEVDPPEEGTVQSLLQALPEKHPDLRRLLFDEAGNLQPTILVFVGDDQVDHPATTSLQDGQSVTLLSPIAGG